MKWDCVDSIRLIRLASSLANIVPTVGLRLCPALAPPPARLASPGASRAEPIEKRSETIWAELDLRLEMSSGEMLSIDFSRKPRPASPPNGLYTTSPA